MEKLLYLHQASRYLNMYIDLIRKAPNQGINALEVLAPRVYAGLSGGGAFYDASPLPLNIGKYWILRELARLDVKGFRNNDDRYFQYCWVPRASVLNALGIDPTQPDRHNQLIITLKRLNNGSLPTFDWWFDLAIA